MGERCSRCETRSGDCWCGGYLQGDPRAPLERAGGPIVRLLATVSTTPPPPSLDDLRELALSSPVPTDVLAGDPLRDGFGERCPCCNERVTTDTGRNVRVAACSTCVGLGELPLRNAGPVLADVAELFNLSERDALPWSWSGRAVCPYCLGTGVTAEVEDDE